MKRIITPKTAFWLYKAAFPIYIFSALYITLIDRIPKNRRTQLTPFWELRRLIETDHTLYWLGQISGNLVMLLPLGIMLPVICRNLRCGWKVALIGFAFSLAIELVQYFTGRGLCEFDDVMHNTIGTFLGYLIFPKFWEILTGEKLETVHIG